jgi:16S rRNA (guanine527-N7)-methyltransferase
MEKLAAGVQKLGINLNSGQIEQFHSYYQELIDWNQRINLTSITGYEEVQVWHFLDSLTVTLALKSSEGSRSISVVDVGTGAGLPGIPLKILWPDIRLVLLEATAKKAKFLHHLISRLGLDSVEVVVGRAEEVANDTDYRERFELVLSRAVSALPTLAELTLPFCVVGGSFIAQKKGAIDRELSRVLPAIGILGGNLREVKEVALDEFGDRRWLVVIDKVKPTPHQYPRRPGIPAKRPLGEHE